ncbi:hypothetical protein B0H34DRAFT_731042 [Crassisporium funariophilum]|nr:hypothetical protein B0H34DRAFT_731042 [Crassisporium funariophilum]
MPSQSNFTLPGEAAHPHGRETLMTAAAFAYSRQFNPRRLEDPFYAFWNLVLSFLTYDLQPRLFTVPQLTICHKLNEAVDPDTSINTMAAEPGDESLRPDFVVLCATIHDRYSRRQCKAFENYLLLADMRIMTAVPFLLAEIKRAPTRHARNRAKFRTELFRQLKSAVIGVELQAAVVFADRSRPLALDTVILIAASGDWWKFRIALGDMAAPRMAPFDPALAKEVVGEGTDEDDEYEDGEDQDQDNEDQDNEDQDNEDQDEDDENQDTENQDDENHDDEDDRVTYQQHTENIPVAGYALKRYTDTEDEGVTTCFDDVNDANPQANEWSPHMAFGSKASNQCLYLIHSMLVKMQRAVIEAPPARRDPDDENSGQSDGESEDSEDEIMLKPSTVEY